MTPFISSRIASIIYALAVGCFGILHFKYVQIFKGNVPEFMPGDGSIWIYLTGTCMILAAISIIIKKYTTLACYLLALMFVIFIVSIHIKPLMDGIFTNLLKDTAMAMGAILIGNLNVNKS